MLLCTSKKAKGEKVWSMKIAIIAEIFSIQSDAWFFHILEETDHKELVKMKLRDKEERDEERDKKMISESERLS